MNKILIALLIVIVVPIAYAGSLVHPLDFKGTKKVSQPI